MKDETKSAQMLIRIQPTLKAVAERAAKDDARSLSSLVEKVLIDHLAAKGYLLTQPEQRKARAPRVIRPR